MQECINQAFVLRGINEVKETGNIESRLKQAGLIMCNTFSHAILHRVQLHNRVNSTEVSYDCNASRTYDNMQKRGTLEIDELHSSVASITSSNNVPTVKFHISDANVTHA